MVIQSMNSLNEKTVQFLLIALGIWMSVRLQYPLSLLCVLLKTGRHQQIRVQLSMVLQAVVSQQLIPVKDGTGEVPALEIMFLNNAIRNMIRESKIHQIDGVISTSAEEGMVTMDNSLLSLYRQGKIAREDAVMYSGNSELMEKKINRL